MFHSNYIPVNINRQNAVIYTEQGPFPVSLLKSVREVLANGKTDNNVILQDGTVTFISNPEYVWTIPAVYVACEALDAAEKNKFSFFTVLDKKNVPQLFISKAVKGHRLLVNALTFQTIIVTKPNLVRKITAMIDHRYSTIFCINMFKTLAALENNAVNYLEALIVDRGMETETVCVSPITTLYADIWEYYSADTLNEFRDIIDNGVKETESFRLENNKLYWKPNDTLQPLPLSHAKEMLALYDKLIAKKCNYICLNGDDNDCYYYISTNWRYFVNAKTFEVRIVTNEMLKQLLQNYAQNNVTPIVELHSVWESAKGEN